MAFLGAFLAATAGLLLLGLAPLPLGGTVLAWLIIAAAAWWYARSTTAQANRIPQPAALAIANGALLGLCAQMATLGIRIDAWGFAGLATALVIAAAAGAGGGVVAALQIKKRRTHRARRSLSPPLRPVSRSIPYARSSSPA